MCNRTYYTKSGLQAHIRQLHAPATTRDPVGFSCKHCSLKCPTRYDLIIHRKEAHACDINGEKCSECPMTFRTLTELKRHNISGTHVTLNSIHNTKLTLCISKTNFLPFIAEHSNRPYPCPNCPHRSKTRDKLERHLLSHSTPRESYQCQHCEKNFAFKNSLKKHLEKGRCDVLKRLQKDNTFISNNVATIMGMNMTEDLDLLS